MKYDYLIVGAGFAGSVLAERIASQLGKKVLVIDKRDHIGGNCFDYKDQETNILIHKYGPHIFHTTNHKVWNYLSHFTEWEIYFHKVLAVVEGQKIPVPFNLNSLYQVFPQKYASKLEKILIDKYGFGIKIPILKLKESDDKELKFLADYIYKNIFLGYTLKQWDLKPEELDHSVTSRIPVNISRDDRYFQDNYQGIPKLGYSHIFEKLLSHKNIEVILNTNFINNLSDFQFDKLIYTGPADSFFDYLHGKLPYRSLEFKLEQHNSQFYQEVSQVNYPNNFDFTRITEFRHFHNNLNYPVDKTLIAKEYSSLYLEGTNDPYYPIPSPENDLLFSKYQKEILKLKNIIFTGRLADYKYYNMDQVIAVALQIFEKKIASY